MKANEARGRHATRAKKFIEAGSLLMLALAVAAILAVHRNSEMVNGLVVVLCTMVPGAYVAGRHTLAKAHERDTGDLLVKHTLAYLSERVSEYPIDPAQQKWPVGWRPVASYNIARTGIEQIPPMEGFREFQGAPNRPRAGRLVAAGTVARVLGAGQVLRGAAGKLLPV